MRRSHSGKLAPVSRYNSSILTFLHIIFTFPGGYGYEPLPSTSTHNVMEDENERMTEELKDKIHALKSLSIDIGTEVKYQDKMLRGMVSWPACLKPVLHVTLNIRNNIHIFHILG